MVSIVSGWVIGSAERRKQRWLALGFNMNQDEHFWVKEELKINAEIEIPCYVPF